MITNLSLIKIYTDGAELNSVHLNHKYELKYGPTHEELMDIFANESLIKDCFDIIHVGC